MKIAIIADVHDNLPNLKKFINWANFNDIQIIICAGDLTNEETANYLADKFNKNIYIVSGNQELYEPSVFHDHDNVHHLGKTGIFLLAGIKIGLCHEPHYVHELLEKRPDLDFIFYGHTHKPWIEMHQDTKIINPGTLGGVFQKASFAIYDTDYKELKLKILENLKNHNFA